MTHDPNLTPRMTLDMWVFWMLLCALLMALVSKAVKPPFWDVFLDNFLVCRNSMARLWDQTVDQSTRQPLTQISVASRSASLATAPTRTRLTCIFVAPCGYRRSAIPPCAHRSQGRPRQTPFVSNTPTETAEYEKL